MIPGNAPGAPRLAARRHRGGSDRSAARPKPLLPKALLPWRRSQASSPDEPDDDDFSSPPPRAESSSLFLDEDDYELTDEELEAKMPSSSGSSSSSSLALLRDDDDGDGGNDAKHPLASLASAARSRLGRGARRLRARARRATADLPDDLLGRALWLWESRPVARARLAVSVAAAGARAPALVALIASQAGGVVASTQLSLPVVAPLLIGLPVLARSVAANASAVAPRAAAAALLLWLAWFCNKVATSTALYLRRQGALDARVAGAAVACSEVLALSAASLVLLSALGVNVSALLFPAAALAGWAAADGAKCFGAGAFLFAAQPFRLGDRVAVRAAPGVPVSNGSSAGAPPPRNLGGGGRDGSSYSSGYGNGSAFSSAGAAAAAAEDREREGEAAPPQPSSWFDGRVEHVDLRYTVVRRGNARMFLPNSSFLTREFLVFDAPERQVRTRGGGEYRVFCFFLREKKTKNTSKKLTTTPPQRRQQQQQPQPLSMSSSMAAAARRRRAAASQQQQRDAGTQTPSRGGGGGGAFSSSSAAVPPSSYPLPSSPPQPVPQSAGWSNYAPGAWSPQQQQQQQPQAQAQWRQQQQQQPPLPPSKAPPPPSSQTPPPPQPQPPAL